MLPIIALRLAPAGELAAAQSGGKTNAPLEILPNELAAGDDTRLLVLPLTDAFGFDVLIRTRVQADTALITVFYHDRVSVEGKDVEVLLSMESSAPLAGPDAYGGTRRGFKLAPSRIAFIRAEFFKKSGTRETAH